MTKCPYLTRDHREKISNIDCLGCNKMDYMSCKIYETNTKSFKESGLVGKI